jgi:hypothetical protein
VSDSRASLTRSRGAAHSSALLLAPHGGSSSCASASAGLATGDTHRLSGAYAVSAVLLPYGGKMLEMRSDLAAGGYFIARPYAREESMSDLLPSIVVSASPCIADIGPSLTWDERTTKDEEEAAGLGIATEQLDTVARWLANAYESGRVRWPNVLDAPEVARAFVTHFDLRTNDLVLLGIALPEHHVGEFLDEQEEWLGVRQLLEERKPLASSPAEVLGYEVLGHDFSTFHSWLCNRLERDAAAELRITPDERGFLNTLEEAERVARWANEDKGTEPVLWQPWLVVRYAWS